MNDREALLRTIAEFPEEDTPRNIFADWCEENGESSLADLIRSVLTSRKVTTSWNLWRVHPTNPTITAVLKGRAVEVELDRCPVIKFTALQWESRRDDANRDTVLYLSWEEWDAEISPPLTRRCVLQNIISDRELRTYVGDFEDHVRDYLRERARRARTPVGYLSRMWPWVGKWTFPDDVQEQPVRTLLLSRAEAFDLASNGEVREYMVRSPDFLRDLNAYGLPERLLGLNIVVDPDVPPRNDPIPERLNRATIERWLRSPRTYQAQVQ